MRDEEGDPAVVVYGARLSGEAFEERVFGLRVKGCRRLVEDEDKWPFAHEAAGQCHLLPLAE